MTNDKQRDRLAELLQEASSEAGKHFRETTKKVLAEKGRFSSKEDIDLRNIYEVEADYLLANGVIVPPVKVGDEVYVVIKNMPFVPADVYECEVAWYALGKDGLRPTVLVKSDNNIIKGASLGVYIGDIYFTREEAEKALKGSEM